MGFGVTGCPMEPGEDKWAWFRHRSQDMGTWPSQDLGRISEAIIAVTSLGRALTQNVGISM